MTWLEYADLVQQMRAAQREYFKNRSRGALGESKRLEREVDKVTDEMMLLPNQATLFDLKEAP